MRTSSKSETTPFRRSDSASVKADAHQKEVVPRTRSASTRLSRNAVASAPRTGGSIRRFSWLCERTSRQRKESRCSHFPDQYGESVIQAIAQYDVQVLGGLLDLIADFG